MQIKLSFRRPNNGDEFAGVRLVISTADNVMMNNKCESLLNSHLYFIVDCTDLCLPLYACVDQ